MIFKHEESKTFINVGIVLNERGEVLMIRRAKPEKGKDGSILEWAFPGGKQRYKETREECVKREVLAETGYDITPIRQISLRVHPQIDVIIVYHLCSLNQPEPICTPQEPYEIAEIRWVKPKEILTLCTTDIDPKVKVELGLE